MSTPLGFIDRIKAAIISLFKGPAPKGAAPPAHPRPDQTKILCNPGSGGFLDARIERNMKGNTFEWRRVGTSLPAGSHFEIRPKDDHPSLLDPAIPKGTDVFKADVNWEIAKDGDVYHYSLWQVKSDGSDKELDDPDIEIVF